MKANTSPLELYWVSGSPYSWRVLLALEAKKLAWVSRLLNASEGEHKSEAYLQLNPRGKVPTLRHGELVLTESVAIMEYLDEVFPEVPLFGRTVQERARTRRLVSEVYSYLGDASARIIVPLYFGRAAERAADIRESIPKVLAELAQHEATLGDAPWLGRESIGAADIALYPLVKSLLRAAGKEGAGDFDLGLLPFEPRFPRLAAWMRRVEAMPGYERTYPPHWGAVEKSEKREAAVPG